MKEETLILEIKGNSLDDGPGIRTVVFFKGCPLKCIWCHNPESKKPGPEISYDKNKCINCGACKDICSAKAISENNQFFIDRLKCTLCLQCTDICPSTAVERIGKTMTLSDITNKILRDKPFFDSSGGGVTLSGGEPMLHIEFASSLLKDLKQNNLRTLIETCGYFNFNKFETLIMPYIDIIYFDLKLFDEMQHKKYCGISNSTILDNFTKLTHCAEEYNLRILPRIPLIPEITDSEKNLNELADFLQYKTDQISLLPYNPLWLDKNIKLGINFDLSSDNRMRHWINPDSIKIYESLFVKRGIKVVSG